MFQVCNTSIIKQLEQQVFLLQIYMSLLLENINIPKYLAFLLKASSLYPEESVLYYSGNYHEPKS